MGGCGGLTFALLSVILKYTHFKCANAICALRAPGGIFSCVLPKFNLVRHFMKRYILLLLALFIIVFACSSCAQGKNTASSGSSGDSIDKCIDLTQMSDTLLYAKVNDMIENPDEYKGKTIKIKGAFSSVISSSQNSRNYACVVTDANGCCSQGLEFVPYPDYMYPDDFPKLWDDITVFGIFETYQKDSSICCRLINAEIEE